MLSFAYRATAKSRCILPAPSFQRLTERHDYVQQIRPEDAAQDEAVLTLHINHAQHVCSEARATGYRRSPG